MLQFNSVESTSVADTARYSHIADSSFKKSFLSIIQGSIVEKLKQSKCEIAQEAAMDDQFYVELQSKQTNPRYVSMMKKRMTLPSYSERENVLKMIEENQVVLISGETGCGKTTQVAQFILNDHIEKMKGSMCNVVCTQPRRISAISVAERVAEERAEKIGSSVGYHIRLEK